MTHDINIFNNDGEAIIMLLVNYGNFCNVVAENIIKTVGLNDKCVSLAIYILIVGLCT